MMKFSYLIAMLLGIGGSLQIHISKCLQIIGLRHHKDKLLRTLPPAYIWGFVLSNTVFVWVLFSNKYAPTSVFTSMFGVGSIVLVYFARKYLNEKLDKNAYLGLGQLLLGTVLISISRLNDTAPDYSSLKFLPVYISTATLLVLAGIFYFRNKLKQISGSATIYIGFLCGAMGSLDLYLKGIGQNMQNSAKMFPTTRLGWIIFLSSLIFSTLSFLLSQWSFARKVRATIFIPAFNISYIIYPIFLDGIVYGKFGFNFWGIAGLVLVVLGTIELRNMGKIYAVSNIDDGLQPADK